jgi:hypothetical protein
MPLHLVQLILLIGNYLNGNSYGGGAFGFKIDSINKVRLPSFPSVSVR